MCWTTTQPNWLLVFFTQQKTKTHDDSQALPNFFPPTTTESFSFYNFITLPNNQQAFVPKTKTKIQPTITIHNPYI
jgi:hypothetical protein